MIEPGTESSGRQQHPQIVRVAEVMTEARHLVVGLDLDRILDRVGGRACRCVGAERHVQIAGLDPELRRRHAMPRRQEDVVSTVLRLPRERTGADPPVDHRLAVALVVEVHGADLWMRRVHLPAPHRHRAGRQEQSNHQTENQQSPVHRISPFPR